MAIRRIGRDLYAGDWEWTPWYLRFFKKKSNFRRRITTERDTEGPSSFWEYM